MVNDPNLDPTMNNPMMRQQFLEGAPVFDINGEKVGDVSKHGVREGNLVIHRGLFQKDVYLPLSSIARNDANGVNLNIAKDDLKDLENRAPGEMNQEDANTGPWGDVGSTGAGLNTSRAGANQPMGAQTTPPAAGTTPNMPARNAGAQQGIGNAGATPVQDGDVAIPLREEQMIVNRERDMQAGGKAHVRKDVIEEQRNITTPVTHEELRVEHNPVQGNIPATGEDAFAAKDLNVPLMGERVNVTKEPRVVDEVHLHKQQVTEEQQATGKVRKERLNVEGMDQNGQNLDERRGDLNRDDPNQPLP